MENNLKTFRYTYIFKNLGVVYLLFLALGIWITFAFDGPIIFLFILLGVGGLGIVMYMTTSVTISNEEISARTLTGSNALRWSEIDSVTSTISSFKLVNMDGDISVRVNSRLDGYTEIFGLLYQKRADLFDANKFKLFSKNIATQVIGLVVYGLLFVVGVLRYVFGRDWTSIGMIVVFGSSVFYLLKNLLITPKGITLEPNTLTLQYFRKISSYSRDDIGSIMFGRSGVLIILKNNLHMVLPNFSASPILIYFVLKRWFENSIVKSASDSHFSYNIGLST